MREVSVLSHLSRIRMLSMDLPMDLSLYMSMHWLLARLRRHALYLFCTRLAGLSTLLKTFPVLTRSSLLTAPSRILRTVLRWVHHARLWMAPGPLSALVIVCALLSAGHLLVHVRHHGWHAEVGHLRRPIEVAVWRVGIGLTETSLIEALHAATARTSVWPFSCWRVLRIGVVGLANSTVRVVRKRVHGWIWREPLCHHVGIELLVHAGVVVHTLHHSTVISTWAAAPSLLVIISMSSDVASIAAHRSAMF
mmetsp:Transcript_7045/g.21482  ORF Transcript_7045/g.21482 Transcript_7045/m.21482 type:complete len:251 (-) Transcript_7045:698-1450(-)